MRALLLVAILGSLWASSGCDRLREKQAVRRYALETREVELRVKRVQSAAPELEALRGDPEGARLGLLLKDSLLPALRGLVEAIQGLPAEAVRLRRMREPLLRAAKRAQEACETLADRVGGGPLKGAWDGVFESLDALFTAVRVHHRALDVACREHDLRR